MVRDPDDARDLCQEAFLRVHRQLHQFRFECPLESPSRVARHEAD
jgi:RNA polymerase sigma-70 factor (ECF subfamily)